MTEVEEKVNLQATEHADELEKVVEEVVDLRRRVNKAEDEKNTMLKNAIFAEKMNKILQEKVR